MDDRRILQKWQGYEANETSQYTNELFQKYAFILVVSPYVECLFFWSVWGQTWLKAEPL